MIIRAIEEKDLEQLKNIHASYYKDEFTFEDFVRSSLFNLLCEDDDGAIITAANIRTLLEIVMLTDKHKSSRIRREALLRIFHASLVVAGKTNHNSLHAFVQDENWYNKLKRYGFRDSVGKSLVIG